MVTNKEVARNLALQCTCAQQGKQHRIIKGTWRVEGRRVPASIWCGGYCTGFAHNVLEALGQQVKDDMLDCYTAAADSLLDDDMREIFEEEPPEEPLEKKRRKQKLLDDVPESIRKNLAKKRRDKLQDDVPHSIRKHLEQKSSEATKTITG